MVLKFPVQFSHTVLYKTRTSRSNFSSCSPDSTSTLTSTSRTPCPYPFTCQELLYCKHLTLSTMDIFRVYFSIGQQSWHYKHGHTAVLHCTWVSTYFSAITPKALSRVSVSRPEQKSTMTPLAHCSCTCGMLSLSHVQRQQCVYSTEMLTRSQPHLFHCRVDPLLRRIWERRNN